MVERLNGTLKAIMRSTSEVYGTNWALYLQASTFAYNISPKERDGISPFYALYGRHPYIPGEVLSCEVEFDPTAGDESQYVRDTINRLREAHLFMVERIQDARRKERIKQAAQGPTHAYQVGDLAYLKQGGRIRGPKAGAFTERYLGPYEIISRVGEVNYDIAKRDASGKLGRTAQLVHVDDLRKVAKPADHNPAAPTAITARPMLSITEHTPPAQELPKNFAIHTRPKKARVPQPVIAHSAPPKPPRALPNRHERQRILRELSDAERAQQDFADIQPSLTIPPIPPPQHTRAAPAPSAHGMSTRSSRNPHKPRPSYAESDLEQKQLLEAIRDLSLPIRK